MESNKISPFLTGIVDTFLGVELLRNSNIPHKNRLAVILIDSACETACRTYLQYVAKIPLSDSHKHRDNLMKAMKGKLKHISSEVWDNIDFYYQEIRCDFYHQSAGKTITDVTLLDYKDTVEFVIDESFGVKISELVSSEVRVLKAKQSENQSNYLIPIHKIKDKLDKIIVAVDAVKPKGAEDLNEYLKKEGDSLRLQADEFLNVLARNSGSKKMFYYDKELKVWNVSVAGRTRLTGIIKELNHG